jgi:hypothetical protein
MKGSNVSIKCHSLVSRAPLAAPPYRAALPNEGISSVCRTISLIENSFGRRELLDAFTLGDKGR